MILSIDCGTQSTRAILFSLEGEIIDKEQIMYEPYVSEKAGWAEQNAEIYWESLCKASLELSKRNKLVFSNILGVGITTLRSTMVNVDNQGNILRPSLVWLDQRTAKNVYTPNFALDLVFRAIGVKSTLQKMERKGQCNWIRQNEPEIWSKTHKYLQISAFLNYRLTGNFTDSVASQIGYIPFDYKKQTWANPKDLFEFSGKLYPIEKEKLPELVNPGERVGEVSKIASHITGIPEKTPVIACGSDKGCETLGMGVTDTTIASLSFGTTATVQTTVSSYLEPIRFFPAYPSLIPKHWNPEIEIYRGFWMISWFKNEFALKEVQKAAEMNIPAEVVMNELLINSPAGAMGLIVQPYWSPGLGEKNAKGAMIGFGDVHKKEHVYRAVIEGLVYALKEGKERIEKVSHTKIHQLAVSGGASQSDEICQITADIFNLPVVRGNTTETSSLGAAVLIAFGTGIYPTIDEAVKNMVHLQNEFHPDEKHVHLYEQLYRKVYKKLYKKLETFYHEIRDITGYPE